MKGRRILFTLVGLIAFVVAILFLTPFGKGVRDIAGTGVVTNALARPDRRVEGDTVARLQAIRTAFELYHKSEDHYPEARGWSDAVIKRFAAADYAKGEETRGLIRPGARQFGYALNAAAAGKFRKDVGPPSTILVYETGREIADAVGDPARDALPSGKGITIDGKIVNAR